MDLIRRRGNWRKELRQRNGGDDDDPTVEMAEKSNPADGTVALSMLFEDPMKRIRESGSADFSSSPIASAAEMCPAVPPADKATRKPEVSSFFAAEVEEGRSTERQQTVEEEERVSRLGTSLVEGEKGKFGERKEAIAMRDHEKKLKEWKFHKDI